MHRKQASSIGLCGIGAGGFGGTVKQKSYNLNFSMIEFHECLISYYNKKILMFVRKSLRYELLSALV